MLKDTADTNQIRDFNLSNEIIFSIYSRTKVELFRVDRLRLRQSILMSFFFYFLSTNCATVKMWQPNAIFACIPRDSVHRWWWRWAIFSPNGRQSFGRVCIGRMFQRLHGCVAFFSPPNRERAMRLGHMHRVVSMWPHSDSIVLRPNSIIWLLCMWHLWQFHNAIPIRSEEKKKKKFISIPCYSSDALLERRVFTFEMGKPVSLPVSHGIIVIGHWAVARAICAASGST